VFIFNIFPPKQHLHERRIELPVRGYNRSCGKSNSPAPLHRVSSLGRDAKIENSTRKQNFKSKRTVGTLDLSIDTRKHMFKSHETTSLKLLQLRLRTYILQYILLLLSSISRNSKDVHLLHSLNLAFACMIFKLHCPRDPNTSKPTYLGPFGMPKHMLRYKLNLKLYSSCWNFSIHF
jgi:hypothetical protein